MSIHAHTRRDAGAQAEHAGLAADDTGGDGRPALVLLHGLTYDRTTWRPIVERVRALDPQRRVVSFDLPGHGGSAMQDRLDLPGVVDALEAALDAAAVEEPVLVGHSMSGGLATLVGGRRPVRAIVDVDQPPDLEPFLRTLRAVADQLRSPRFADVWQRFADGFHLELLPADLRALVEAACHPDQRTLLAYWEPLIEAPIDRQVALVDHALARLAAARTPYWLVMGSPLPAALEERLRDRLPALEVLDWSPGSHFPHLARPDRFAELLTSIT